MNHSGDKGGILPVLCIADEKETEQFHHLQGLLGTLLLALNWHGWADEDRATLLHCIDCLERKLIDIKRGVR